MRRHSCLACSGSACVLVSPMQDVQKVASHNQGGERALHLLGARATLLMRLSRSRQGDRPGGCRQLPSRPGQWLRDRQLHGGPLLPGRLPKAAQEAGRQMGRLLPQLLGVLRRQLPVKGALQPLLWRRQGRRLRQHLRLPGLLRLLHGRRPGQLLPLPLLLLLHGQGAYLGALLLPVLELLRLGLLL